MQVVMIYLKSFVFNGFQVNTYVLYDDSKECIIIDPACYQDFEKKQFINFIQKQELIPVCMINTHCHIDHVLGNNFVFETYGIKPEIHKDGLPFINSSTEQAWSFGFEMDEIVKPEKFLKEDDIVKFGNSELEVIYTPGHADGSICLISSESKFVITGDVLFEGSIGRTDLPTGDFEVLTSNIREKLFILPDDYIVYPGHGLTTTIGFEKRNNPFVGIDNL